MIYTGTCGYSYKDWIGPFYPDGTTDNRMLEYYAQEFRFVELNSTFYHMPRLQLFKSIADRTPQDFKLSVKLFQGFSHTGEADSSMAEAFLFSLKPVMEKNRLICLLAQYPWSFRYSSENADRLKQMREWFSDIDINVEFRNREWIKEETTELLKSEKLGFVCVDEPRLKGLVGSAAAVT